MPSRALCLVGHFAIAIAATAAGAEEWHVSEAVTRVECEIVQSPTHEQAGVIVVIPDGGALPSPFARADIVSHAGRAMRSAVVWHNPKHGMALVTQAGVPRFWVYLSKHATPTALAPSRVSGFKPGLLYYVKHGVPGLEQARGLAMQRPAGEDILFAHIDRIYDTDPPAGRNGMCSDYYSGSLAAGRAGAAYFYSIAKDGAEFYIDGTMVHRWSGAVGERGGPAGEHGGWVTLTGGLHRVDYFHFNVDGRAIDHLDPGGREAHLGWRPPDPAIDSADPPSGVPKGAQPLGPRDYVLSGRAEIRGVEARPGPIAMFEPKWIAYVAPETNLLCHYLFEALGADAHPPDSQYEWTLGRGARAYGARVEWFFPDRNDRRVTLTVRNKNGRHSATREFYPKHVPARRYSIKSPEDRAECRAALLRMIRACDRESDLGMILTPAFLRSVCGILDVGPGYDLLQEIRLRAAQPVELMTRDERLRLKLAMVDSHRARDEHWPSIPTLNTYLNETEPQSIRRRWLIEQADYPRGRPAGRAAGARILRMLTGETQESTPTRILAFSRLGDTEFVAGQFEAARTLYRTADTHARTRFHDGLAPFGRKMKEDALRAAFERRMKDTLYVDARETLTQWEMEFPLSKIDGTLLLSKADWLIAAGRYNQARTLLSACRKHKPQSKRCRELLERLKAQSPAGRPD